MPTKSKDGLPLSYSAVPVSNTEVVEDQGAQAFMTAFLKVMQEGNATVPPALQPFLPDQEREEMKSQQKLLNRMRSVKQKIQGKEKAISKDDAQWKKWLEEVRQVIQAQKKEHEENQERLQKELQDLRAEEEKLRAMKPSDGMDLVEDEEKKEDVEEALSALLQPDQPKEEPKASSTEEELQQQMNQRLLDMQSKLQEEFQQKLQLAENAMAQRYQDQLQQQAASWRAQQASHVINLEEEIGDATVPIAVGYGAHRPRNSQVSSPYRKEEEAKTEKAEGMEERLQRTHGPQAG